MDMKIKNVEWAWLNAKIVIAILRKQTLETLEIITKNTNVYATIKMTKERLMKFKKAIF